MKRNRMVFTAAAAILAGLAFAAFFSCDNDLKGREPDKTTYTGTDMNGTTYMLVVVDEDEYELFIDNESTSSGRVRIKKGDTYELAPGNGEYDFEVTVDGNNIIKIEGKIFPDDENEPIAVGRMRPPTRPEPGNWTWSTGDDAKSNGGVSRITNAILATDVQSGQVPYKYPAGSVKDNNGKTINAAVYNFTGNTRVIKDNRGPDEGARFPQVGWEAQPDAATLELLKTAYGYSFWARLNSSTGNNWSFVSAVITDFPPEEGHEYRHWFGNTPGASGGTNVNNFSGYLEPGKWYQITVIMAEDGFNMEQDKWIHEWNKEYIRPFNQNMAQKIQWQILLQRQEGAGAEDRGGPPYDITKGSYDFNLDFYGLELLILK